MSKVEIIGKAVAEELVRQQASRAWDIQRIEQGGHPPLTLSVDGEINLFELAYAIENALDRK